jgi:DNA processing protein
MDLFKEDKELFGKISMQPLREVAAYEALWQQHPISFKKIAEIFLKNKGDLPSNLVPEDQIKIFSDYLMNILLNENETVRTHFLIHNTYDYPNKLRDAQDPVELLYYQGDLNFLNTRSVAIVGTRNPTEDGLTRTAQLVKRLVKDNFTIVSGLAKGIDTKAHKTAIENEGRTISVIGTPLNEVYPKENKDLQKFIAKNHLLISQIPYWKYSQQTFRTNRFFFPERNKTMSALTEATVIIEAGETSGTLIQAKAALYQKRKLFVLESCFNNKSITWPARFEKEGAIRVRSYDDIRKVLMPDDLQVD